MRRSTCLAAVLAAGLTGATSAMAGLLYEPGNYAAQGNLLLQLDGIRNVAPLRAHDGQATTWRDLSSSCNLLAFEDAHATANVVSEWAADGYTFGGGAYGKLQRTLNVGSAFTVQIVCDVTPSAQETNYPSLFGAADDKCNFYTYGKGTTLNFKSVKGGRVQCAGWTGRYVTGLYNKAKAVVFHAASGTVEEGADATSVGNQTYCVGSVFKSTDANHAVERYLNGTIKAVRVYNKVLTEAELEQNRALDDARFFDGIPVTNVVVATAVAGAEGNEGSGAYAFDADGYTFSAPQRTVLDGATYACAGYTLETWDGSAWSAPAAYSSCSYAATDTSAKVRLTWQWVRAPGEAPAAFDTTLGDYVTDGLVFHIDGIRNAGAGQPHDPNAVGWTDLVSGNTSVLKHDKSDGSGWLADGYFFGGASYAEFTERLTGLTNTVTVQVVCDVNPLLLEGTSKWPMLVGCNDNDTCNLYYELNGTSHRLTFKNANGGHAKMEAKTWEGRYGTAIRDGTTNYIFQTTRIADAMTAAAASGNIGTAAVRVGSAGSTPALRRDRWFTGIIKAVRIYDRVLTDDELEQNRAVDEARFFGAEPPEPNVEVASSVRGLPLSEPEGAYALPPEGYTFTAPASVTRGEDTYSCTGYTLETWDEATGAWGAPEAHDGMLACALSDMAARVRLTWQWTHTAGPGYDAAFDDYVADGLVLHLDGIRNAGLAPARDTGSAAWADIGSVGGYARFVHNAADGSAWTADGYAFGGTSYAVMNGVRTLGTAFTAQVVSEVDSYVNCRTAMVWPGLIGTTAGSGDPFPMYMNNNNSNKASVNCKVGGTNVGIYINDWAGEYATAWSDGVNASLFDTVKAASTTPFVHAAGTRTFTVGGGNGGTPGYATRYLLGAIKAVRLYGRALTDAE
ncbi:MAG: hypothetical protein IJ658_01045, partial [Kiritimatiellae bacterium]|nr:hypothetical protein [Kiritimatiellia bacterium]